ncbi:MAG TPA: DUF4350 domain-containing protein, partial [Gemmatimonadaceae bacterium]|nr:DUF4350 domain-containing protein [Gemmatimonadaceae bacterium]
MAERSGLERWLTPRVVLVGVVLLIVGAFALIPRSYTGDAVPPLTSYSANQYGSRGLLEIWQRLGWRVQRRLGPLYAPLDTSAVYLVLDPPLTLTTNEVRDLLEAVRRGASAVVVPRADTPLADSLHLAQSESTMMPYAALDSTQADEEPSDSAETDSTATDSASADTAASSASADSDSVASDDVDEDTFDTADPTELSVFWRYLTPTAPLPRDTAMFAAVRDRKHRVRPVVLGLPLGRGRLVVVADPRIFRNEIVRQGDAAVFDTRLIEWLTR